MRTGRPGAHRPWSGVRARSALAAAVVVAVALVAGATLLLVVLQRDLVSGVEQAATARARDVSRLLVAEGPADVAVDLHANAQEGHVVQLVDGSGHVVASSTPRAAQRPLSTLRPAAGTVVHSPSHRLVLLDGDQRYLFVAQGVTYRGQTYTVLVSTSVVAERESVRTVLSLLLAGFPLVLVLVAGATWVLVGRALQPVERIRSRVSRIGGSRLDERVPVPQTGDEIARLAETMNRMLDRLERAQLTQRRFVSDASHELRSPLATLAATLDVAAADPSGAAWRDLRGVMTLETERMSRLVDDLLLLARSDDAGLQLRLAEVDLDDLVDEEVRRLRSSSGLTVTARTQPVRVVGDAAKLRQVLRNLADNAVRHARSQVRIELATDGADAVLAVEDDGSGVPVADRERVFDRFVRLDDSRDRGSGGSGLGLAIVREVATGHAGSATVGESSLGGCRVEVRLPHQPPAAEPAQPPVAASR